MLDPNPTASNQSTGKKIDLVLPIVSSFVDDNIKHMDGDSSIDLVELVNEIINFKNHSELSGIKENISFEFFDLNTDCKWRWMYDYGSGSGYLILMPASSFIQISVNLENSSDRETIVQSLLFYVENIIIAASLSRLGAISFLGICIYKDNSLKEISGRRNDFSDVVEDIKKDAWPETLTLNVCEVLEWLYSIEGFYCGFPKGHIGRAISALTRVICTDSEIDFVWSLIGLEALYGRDGGSKSNQILSKSEALLGPRNKKTRSLGKAYDFRSLFLHGSADIPLEHSRWHDDYYKQYYAKSYKASSLATGVLLCSLQHLAKRKLKSLNFNFHVTD